MNEDKSTGSIGIVLFIGWLTLQVVLIIQKIMSVIEARWVMVFLPTIIPVGLFVLLLFLGVIARYWNSRN